MKLYLAGPLFTTAERTFNVRLRDFLVAEGHECWLPQEREPREKTAKAIFEMDVEGVDWCDMVVACMDGPDPDSGTCWECGYAYRKKPIMLYRSDFRAIDDGGLAPYNLMLTESAAIRVALTSFEGEEKLFRTIASSLELVPIDVLRDYLDPAKAAPSRRPAAS